MREQYLEELRATNIKMIEELARQQVQFTPQIAQQLLFQEMLDVVFPPDSTERLEAFIRMEEKIKLILKDAKSKATQAQLLAGVNGMNGTLPPPSEFVVR